MTLDRRDPRLCAPIAPAWFAGACLFVILAVPARAVAEEAAPRASDLRLDLHADSAVTGASAGIGLILELIVGTGELRPQAPVDPSVLLSIDRPSALSDETEESGPLLSNIALGASLAYAAFDSTWRGLEEGSSSAATYGVLYAEALAINWALVGVVKIAVRRPRPIAYREYRRTGMVSSDTNTALSFYSGHTAAVAGVAATATYLAFDRDPMGFEGWLTLGLGGLLTGFVAVQRVRAGAHFVTDVIAGALVGAAVGTLVPHLHRSDDAGRLALGIAPYSDLEGRYGLVLQSSF